MTVTHPPHRGSEELGGGGKVVAHHPADARGRLREREQREEADRKVMTISDVLPQALANVTGGERGLDEQYHR